MRVAIVIPARYASSRLPGKPLLRATGKYLIQHVYERACQSRAGLVVVATDDERIVEAVRSFGGRVELTRPDHPSGTDRVADVATLAVPITSVEQWRDPACVKVVRDACGRALYFSRSPIPFVRDGEPDFAATPPRFLIHLGLYAYRRHFLFGLA